MKQIAVYIHWPFCQSKCPYCDFNSHVAKTIDHTKWLSRYLEEIAFYKEMLATYSIRSIFFGGGTPSLMEINTVDRILLELNKISSLENTEITLEANPTSFEAKKFRSFKSAGVNRVSLGAQSFNDENLKFLGRSHNATEAVEAISQASNIFNNYSFDLIYALPKQSMLEWQKELEFACSLNPPHISLYQLTIESGTKFAAQYKAKRFILPSDELSNNMYVYTNEFLSRNGFSHYEISNYAKQGMESQHNLAYWEYLPYIGIGPGAHGRIHQEQINADSTNPFQATRSNKLHSENLNLAQEHQYYYCENLASIYDSNFLNKTNVYATQSESNPAKWLEGDFKKLNNSILLNQEEIVQEIILMSLRLSKGLNIEYFNTITGKNFLEEYTNKDFLAANPDAFILSKDAKYFSISQKYRQITDHLIAKMLI